MERYEAYKDSGIEWIGMIPAGWETTSVKSLFTFGKGLPITKADLTEEGIPVISYGQIHSKSNTPAHIDESLVRFVPEAFLVTNPNSLTRQGDFLFADTSEDVEGSGNFVYHDWRMDVFAGYHTLVMFPRNPEYGRYLSYLFQSDEWRSQIRSRVSGVKLYSLTQRILSGVTTLLPPSGEQLAIADYLDTKTAEIDALVADCEKEIELLREYRKAVIFEAITKGFDSDARMKDSGIEWIGEIPERWRIVRVKFLARRLNVGVVINPSAYYDDNGAIPFLKGSNIQGESIDLSDVSMITEESNELLQKTQIHTGDIVMVRVGDPGRSVVVPPELDGANVASMLEVTCGDAIIPEYLCRIFNSHLSALQVGLYTYGAAMKQINVSDLAEFYIPVPESINEQERMMTELNRKTNQIDTSIDAKRTLVNKLREYRRSLISEAVTGKFKIPGV